jgi:(S)-mandelate dehydrogenase
MNPNKALSIEDLRKIAKVRLPKVIYDYLEGGAEDEVCIAANESAFARHRLIPRYLVDISQRNQSVELFGQTYASPFGIAPTGMIAMVRPHADLMLAEAAAEADVPFVISGASTASIEEVARIAPKSWYQHYPPASRPTSCAASPMQACRPSLSRSTCRCIRNANAISAAVG